MGRQDRTGFYRSNRDYGKLLDGEEGEFDEEQDVDEEQQEEQEVTQQEEQEVDEDLSHECQEYLRRRERLKELERQKLRQANGLKEFEKQKSRQANGNGRSLTTSTKKQLPFDNYGSFFGPSEPVVARRVIEARAKEEADRLARLTKAEVGTTKNSGASKSKDESRTSDAGKQLKLVNEAALRSQRLKEARDYSFLFTDEDPTKTPPRNDASTSETRKQIHDRQKSLDIGKGSTVKPQKSSSLTKPSSSIKSTKPNVVMASQKSQERQITSIMKPSKYPEKPAITKSKYVAHAESSHTSRNLSTSHINSNKTISGPGRPSTESSSAKKSSTSATTAQLKSLVASGPKISPKIPPKQQQPSTKLVPGNGAAAKHQLPTNKPMSGKGPPSKPVLDIKKHSLTVQPDRKPSAVILPGRVGSGHVDVKRPLHSESSSKQIKPPSKPIRPPANLVRKRPGDFESDDSFLDDEDDLEGGDVSSMIRRMFGYNPNKYRLIDDEDDRAMEADYRTIQREERRSAKIAREEDEREEALLLEEERRERERKKRRKLQQR